MYIPAKTLNSLNNTIVSMHSSHIGPKEQKHPVLHICMTWTRPCLDSWLLRRLWHIHSWGQLLLCSRRLMSVWVAHQHLMADWLFCSNGLGQVMAAILNFSVALLYTAAGSLFINMVFWQNVSAEINDLAPAYESTHLSFDKISFGNNSLSGFNCKNLTGAHTVQWNELH